MRNLLLLLLAAFTAIGADVTTPGLFYRSDTRVVGATNLYFVNQHITNSTIDGVSSAAIATNSAANKLDITNGAAVNLSADGVPVRAFRLTHSGLVTSIGAGVLIDAHGNTIPVVAQTVTNVASITNFLVVTLSDLTVRSVRRALHSGCVPLGIVVAGTTNITSDSQPYRFALPPDPLYKLKAKLNAGQSTRVTVLGTSIMNFGTGTNIPFQNLLFSPVYSPRGYNVAGASNVTQLKYSMGGTGMHLSAAMLGHIMLNPESAFTVDSPALGQTLGAVGASYDATPVAVPDSILANASDLVIVDDYNYGNYPLSYIEMQLKKASERGADIIIISTGPPPANPTYHYDRGPYWRRMADAHGWAYCDLTAFLRAYIDAGDTSPWADGVHPSYSGNAVIAARVLDLISTYPQHPQLGEPQRWNAVTDYEMELYNIKPPEEFHVIANTARTTGATGQPVLVASQAATVNPLILNGVKTTANSITILDPGEWAIYGDDMWYALDLMLETNPSQFITIEVYGAQGATLLNTVTANFSSAVYDKQPQVIELLTQAQVFANTAELFNNASGYELGAWANGQVKIQNSGTNAIRIIAPIFSTLRQKEVDLRDWDRSEHGTWREENSYWAGSQVKVLSNNSVGASVRLNYCGRGILVMLQQSSGGGTIQAIHDGVSTTIDTHSETDVTYNYYMEAPDVELGNDKWQVAPRDHALSLTVTAAGTNDVAGARSLVIVGAKIIK